MNAISDGGEEGLVREEDEAPTKETDSSLPSREGGGKLRRQLRGSLRIAGWGRYIEASLIVIACPILSVPALSFPRGSLLILVVDQALRLENNSRQRVKELLLARYFLFAIGIFFFFFLDCRMGIDR